MPIPAPDRAQLPIDCTHTCGDTHYQEGDAMTKNDHKPPPDLPPPGDDPPRRDLYATAEEAESVLERLKYAQEHADELEEEELQRQIGNADVNWDDYDNDRLVNPHKKGSE
jgi:hypothetical protein